MGNERSATYQAKVSVCHYFCMGNGMAPEKGQCGVLQQSRGVKHGPSRPNCSRSSSVSGPPEDEE